MKEIQKRNENLPSTISEIRKYIIIGEEALKVHKAKISAIKRLDQAGAAYEAALQDGQTAGELVIDAKALQGKLLAEIPKKSPIKFSTGNRKSLPEGVTKKESHYAQQVASHPIEVAEAKAEAIETGEIVTQKLVLKKIKKSNRPDSKPTPPLPKDEYEVIYADPAWKYDFASETRKIENHYPTMELEKIKALEIPAYKNSVLYMWATMPKLREALEVIEAWGFEYKSGMCWDKEMIGTGYWFRGQHELLLVATKGDFSPPIPEHRISSVLREKRTGHSVKPMVIYELIEKWFPNAKKLELFARKERDNWTSWGNEI